MVTTNFNKSIIILLSLFIMIGNSVFAQKNGFNTENVEYYIQNKKIGLRDITTKKLVVPCKYDYIGSFSKQKLAVFKRNGLYGYINDKGVEVIAPKYQEAKGFSSDDGLAAIKTKGKWGFINKTGAVVITPKYDFAESFTKGLAVIGLNGKRGAINPQGKTVIPIVYEEMSNQRKGGFYDVKQDGTWGVVNSTNTIIIPLIYENQLYFDADDIVSRCKKNDKWGLVNRNGKQVLPCENEQVSNPHEGLVAVKHNGKCGYVDYEGNIIMPFVWEDTDDFNNGIARIKDENGDYCLISIDSRRVKTFETGSLSEINYVDGNYYVHHKDTPNGYKEALLDKNGEPISQYSYDEIEIFHGNGLIGVQNNDKWGFIDLQGKLRIPCQFEKIAYHFEGGCISAMQNGKWGLIDTAGKYITSNCYDEIYLTENFCKLRMGDKWGAVDNHGKELIPGKYEEVGWPNMTWHYFPVKLNGQDGYADFYGNDTF